MAPTNPTAGNPSGNPSISGINDLEIGTIDIAPDYPLAAVRIELVSPTGDGIRCWIDYGLALDVALRIATACMRLRGIAGP
jgi:hypothetical protein